MPKFRSADDILDYAIAREIEAHEFYLDLAGRIVKADLRKAVKDFAADELQHSIRLRAIKAGEVAFIEEEIGHLGVAETVPEIEPHPDMSYVDLLVLAMNREKAAFRIYTNLASIVTEKGCREVFLGLAQEEAQHKLRLEIEYDLTTF